jgi:hypothetical protein
MSSIDLTNSDDDDIIVPVPVPRRRQACVRQCGSGQSSMKPLGNDFVDLTADTPPERRAARARSAAMGKIAIDFDDEEGASSSPAAACGGSASSHTPSKRSRRRVMEEEEGLSCASGMGGRPSASEKSIIWDFGVQSNEFGVQSKASSGGSSSRASFRANICKGEEASDGDLARPVSCPACSAEIKAGQRSFLSCGHWACSECLIKRAQGEGGCYTCKVRISLTDMQQFLTDEQVRNTTEALRSQLVKMNSNYIQCPNPTCGNVFERMEPGFESSTRPFPRHAPDGTPLTESQARHMGQHRFRCEACDTNFCAHCKTIPYHVAMTCEQAEAARCAAKCRFCQVQLPRGKKDGSTCGGSECEERMATACDVKLKCGHRCLGILFESKCPPCLECTGHAEEFCNICWTEELRAAPCIRLRCGHTFHMHCVKERLKRKWPTPKISFSYAKCPLCIDWVDHPECNGAMRQVHELRTKVEAAALERYRVEGLAKAAQPDAGGGAGGAGGAPPVG